jgi:hypothetical protein
LNVLGLNYDVPPPLSDYAPLSIGLLVLRMEFRVILPDFFSTFFTFIANRFDLFDVLLSSFDEDSESA